MSSIKHLKESVERAKKVLKEHVLFGDIQIIIKDPFQQNINFEEVLKKIEGRLPKFLMREIDIIYIGDFPQLKARNVESAYMNGAIFVSNLIADDDTLIRSIIHEVAHNVENVFGVEVYGDQDVIEEFISKRKRLREILENQNLLCDPRLYVQVDYSKTFDDFLYKTVGYDRLAQLTNKLFLSPYASTSLREYFANGFEKYFADGDTKRVRLISPSLFSKFLDLTNQED